MRRFSFIVFILVIWLATCSGPRPKAPAPVSATSGTDRPATAINLARAPAERLAPEAKFPTAPFDAQTYINTATSFAHDYPYGRSVNELVRGP